MLTIIDLVIVSALNLTQSFRVCNQEAHHNDMDETERSLGPLRSPIPLFVSGLAV